MVLSLSVALALIPVNLSDRTGKLFDPGHCHQFNSVFFLSVHTSPIDIMTCNTDTRTSRWGYDLGRAEAFNMLSCLGHNAGVSLGKLGEKQP